MKGYMSLKRKKGGGGKGKEEGEVDELRFVIAEMVQYVQGGHADQCKAARPAQPLRQVRQETEGCRGHYE